MLSARVAAQSRTSIGGIDHGIEKRIAMGRITAYAWQRDGRGADRGAECRRHCVDAHRYRTRAVHDAAGTCRVLCGPRSHEERIVDSNAVRGHYVRGLD